MLANTSTKLPVRFKYFIFKCEMEKITKQDQNLSNPNKLRNKRYLKILV